MIYLKDLFKNSIVFIYIKIENSDFYSYTPRK